MIAQHAEVHRDRRLGNPELGLDCESHLARSALSIGKQLEDETSNGIAENIKRVHVVSLSI
jgi:hypothetical protein